MTYQNIKVKLSKKNYGNLNKKIMIFEKCKQKPKVDSNL